MNTYTYNRIHMCIGDMRMETYVIMYIYIYRMKYTYIDIRSIHMILHAYLPANKQSFAKKTLFWRADG